MGAWYKDWFASDDYVKVYNHRNSEEAEKFLDFLISKLNLNSDAKLLDAACGAGRHSIYLNTLGYKVVGFDLSKTLLKIARDESEKHGISLNLINADKREIYFKSKFDVVLSLFTSFGYFESTEENYKFVRHAYDFIHEGGYFVLDYLNKNYVLENANYKTVDLIDNKKVTQLRKIVRDRVVKDILIQEGNKKFEYKESVKLYSPEEIINQFENIGFVLSKTFGDYAGKEFDENKSTRFIAVFKK